MVLSKLHGLFKSAYEPKNLLKTNVVASGILLLIGDTIQQSIELYRGVHEKGSYDIPRSSRMLAIGLFHGAPRHFFYVRLEKSIPGTSLKCAAKKVFFDQASHHDGGDDGVDLSDDDTVILFGMKIEAGRDYCADRPLDLCRHNLPLWDVHPRGQGTHSQLGEPQRQVPKGVPVRQPSLASRPDDQLLHSALPVQGALRQRV